MDENNKKERIRVINSAINYWTEKSQGKSYWWDKTNHTKEYCIEQIKYFKNMLKNYKL